MFLLASSVALVVFGGLLEFPGDWDALMYHLPLPDHWLASHSLYAAECLHWYNPGNNELVGLWLVAPFSGDFLSALVNLPATILLALGALEVGFHIGLPVAIRHLSAVAVTAHQVVFYQLIHAGNDVAVAGLFFTSLGYVYRFTAGGRRADLVYGVTALGLLTGVKYYALGYAAVVAVAACWLIARQRGWRDLARSAGWGAAGILAFGSYWYVRNVIVAGSPVFPLGAGSAEDGFRQEYPDLWGTTFAGNRNPDLARLSLEAVGAMTGPGYLVAVATFPVSALWLVVSAGRTGGARVALSLSALGAGLVLAVTPLAVENSPDTLNQLRGQYCPVRYGLCFLSAAVLSLAVALGDLSFMARRLASFLARRMGVCPAGSVGVAAAALFPLAFGIAVVAQFFPRHYPALDVTDSLLIGGASTACLLSVLLLLAGVSHRARVRIAFLSTVALVVTSTIGIGQLSDRWHQGYARVYDRVFGDGLFEDLAAHAPRGTVICVLDLRPYPFFGSARQFQVCQPPPRLPTGLMEQYVRERRAAFVVARAGPGDDVWQWVGVRRWLACRRDLLAPVHCRTGSYVVFKVIKGGPDVSGP